MLEDTAEKFDFAVSSEKFKYTCRRYSFLTKSAKIKPNVPSSIHSRSYSFLTKSAKIKLCRSAFCNFTRYSFLTKSAKIKPQGNLGTKALCYSFLTKLQVRFANKSMTENRLPLII